MFDLRDRTKAFALRIIKVYTALPKTTEAQVIGKQILRSGTSVGAHYREAKRARSTAEFISKIEGGNQELEERIRKIGSIERYYHESLQRRKFSCFG